MESGPAFWLTLLTLGVVVLGGAMAYGMLRNRRRTPPERAVSDAAARAEFKREDRDSA